MTENALARLEKAVVLLESARTLDEVGKIRAMAAAAAEYARAEKLGDEAIRHATEIRVRAARRAGEILAQMTEKAKGAAEPGTRRGTTRAPREDAPPTLAEIGVTKKESARFQAIAAVPRDEFEGALRTEPTISETKMARIGRKKKRRHVARKSPVRKAPEGWEEAGRRDSVVVALESLLALRNPVVYAAACRASVRHLDLAKRAAEWLTEFLDAATQEEESA